MVISKIQEYYIHLFHLVVYYKFHLQTRSNSEFQEIKIWFTDETSKPLEVEDKINLTLIIK